MKSLNQYPLYLDSSYDQTKIIDDMINHFLYFIPLILILFVAFLSYYIVSHFINSPLKQLKKAINNDEMEPWIQPVFDSESNLIGGEVLVRWNHPTQGLIFPVDFIEMAEKNSLMPEISKKLMDRVSSFFCLTGGILPKKFYFAFNVNPRYFNNQALLIDCLDFIERMNTFNNGGIHLVLEITEREKLDGQESFLMFKKFRSFDILIALDDFGTGHSSLDYLRIYNFDFIKIDKSFINDIGNGKHVEHIIKNIVNLSRDLNLKIVAEGIESKTQEDALKKYGVDFYQGYYYSPAVNMFTFIENIKSGKWL